MSTRQDNSTSNPGGSTATENSAHAAAPTIADARAILAATRWGYLAILREDGFPTVRPIGSFAPASTGAAADVYFSTPRESAKACSLRNNPRVNFYFEPTVDNPAAYKAVSLIGSVVELQAGTPDYAVAVEALCAKSVFFKKRAESGDLAATAIYRIHTSELRHSDYSIRHTITEIPVS